MDSKEYFEQFYEKKTEHLYSKSLYHFFEHIIRPRLSSDQLEILELGSGHYSLFEDIVDLNAQVTAIDFSAHAIAKAPKSKILYKELNIVDNLFFNESIFDLVFDSHCVNCIINKTERDIAFKNIYSALKTNGLFASELMIQPNGEKVFMPFKMIKSAIEMEEELLSYGFKIRYFTISRDDVFTNVVDGKEIKCDVLKVIVQK